jgi:outer membrane receptor protein involved in Fe transport
MRAALAIGIACLAVSAPAVARDAAVDAQAGTVGRAAGTIARQTGTSIVVPDRRMAQRRIPAIRGRMDAAEAVRLLARAARARAVPVGANGWRLEPLPTVAAPARPRRQAPPPPAAVPDAVGADIVVVASKRDVPLAQFAGQATIIEGRQLVLGGVGGTEKIMQRAPTLASTYLGSGRNKLFIRGIADSSFTGPTQSTVGQYLGDLRLSYNAPDPDLRLSDLARVEVLEGPQGTLYGAGSLGGILRLVPNDPDPGLTALSAMAGGSAIEHGAAGGDASVTANLPIVADVAALRLTINAESQGGYIDKPLLGLRDVNRTGIVSGRAALRLVLAPDWTVDVIGVGQATDGRDSQYADRGGPPLSRDARVAEGFEADYAHGQVVVTGRIGGLSFKSTTGLTGQQLQERYDATPPGGAARLFTQANDTAMVANETRLWQALGDRFGWLAGVSYTHNRTRLTRTLGAPDEPSSVTGVTNLIDEYTAYGEGSLRLAEGLLATAGARYTRSRLGGQGEDVARVLEVAFADVTASRVEETVLPSASLTATLAPATTLYWRYQQGFRPGGLAISGDFVRRFRNDRLATFEMGLRHGRPGAGPFDLAVSVAHTRWQDIQADFIDGAGFPSTANVGDGRIWTITATAGLRLSSALRLDGGIVWNDSKVDEPTAALALPAITLPGATAPVFAASGDLTPAQRITHVPNIARFSGRIGFDYATALTDRFDLTAQGWAQYVGKSRLGIGPDLGQLQGNYLDSGLNLRAGTPAFGLTLSLFNLTDARGNRFALGTPFAVGRDQVTPLRPRTIRLGIDAAF